MILLKKFYQVRSRYGKGWGEVTTKLGVSQGIYCQTLSCKSDWLF